MSDNTPDNTMSNAIDNLVAAGSGFDNLHVETPQPALKYNSATGELEQTGDSVGGQAIPDTGRVVAAEIAAIQARVDALNAQYRAETDYNKREALGVQLARAREAAEYDVSRLVKLDVQRENTARANEAAANEKLALAAFANGSPARAAAIKTAMLAEEAKFAAQTLINTRMAATKQGRR